VVYADASGTLSPTPTSSTTSGYLVIGNVNPGKYTVTLTATNKVCTLSQTSSVWDGTTENTVLAEVGAGTVTSDILVNCQ
jgi:hypothetical protein